CLIFGHGLFELVAVIVNVPEAIMSMSMVRIEEQDPSHGPFLLIPLLLHFVNETDGKMGFRQALVDTQCFKPSFLGFAEQDRILAPASNYKERITNGKASIS